MQTEYEFILPRGYLDENGNLQRRGSMRLATAMDEIQSLQSPAVQANEAYLPVELLVRVLTSLGDLLQVTPQVVENLFASDLAYLEDLYMRLNSPEMITLGAICPHCRAQIQIQVAPLESLQE